MKTLAAVVLAVSALVSTAAFADAGDRVDQVFPRTDATAPVQASAPATASTATVPAASDDSKEPAFVRDVYFGQ